MRTATPPPETLRRFSLGTLTPDEAERVATWIDETPGAEAAVCPTTVEDTLLGLLSTITRSDLSADSTGAGTDSDSRGTQPEPTTAPYVPAPPPAPPEWFGEYRVVREIDRGGMGVLYEALDDRLRRKVAIKVLIPRLAADPVAHARFLREARAAATIDSPNAVRILHVADAAGAPYMVMEYVEGKTLEQWLRDHTDAVSPSEVLRAARDVFNALVAAQEKGLIHRDIKPSNVMVEGRTGQHKLIDFGLTRSAEPADGVTRVGAAVGTPRYMSPEQATGRPPEAPSDLFSLGATLYRMVAGRSPCLFGNPVDQDDKSIPAPLPLTGVPPEVSRFILRLLAKNPADRPTDASAALVELQAIERRLDAEQTAVILDPPPPPPRNRWLIAAGLAALAATIAAVVIIVIKYENGKDRFEFMLKVGETSEEKKKEVPPGGSGGKVTPPPPPKSESRVRVIKGAVGYADKQGTVSIFHPTLPAGTRGVVKEFAEDDGLYRILPELNPRVEVWVPRNCVEVE